MSTPKIMIVEIISELTSTDKVLSLTRFTFPFLAFTVCKTFALGFVTFEAIRSEFKSVIYQTVMELRIIYILSKTRFAFNQIQQDAWS